MDASGGFSDQTEAMAHIVRCKHASNGLIQSFVVLSVELLKRPSARNSKSREGIFLASLLRCSRTNQAMFILGNSLLTEDVAALGRVLFESAVTGCYLQFAPDQEVKSFQNFWIVSEMKNHMAYEQQLGPLPFVDDDIRSTLKKARDIALAASMRPQRAQSWTDVSVAERAKQVDAKMGDQLFSDLYATLYLDGHSYIHATSLSLETILKELRGDSKTEQRCNELGPTLHAATYTLCALILFCNLFHSLGMNAEVSKATGMMAKV
jgi:hypothetical protein